MLNSRIVIGALLAAMFLPHAGLAKPKVAPPINLPAGPALTEAVRAADADLFTLFFEGCDPKKLATMLTTDLEFYHDKEGVVAKDAASFLSGYAKSCEAKKKPDAWRSRRALLPESLHVDPVPGFGAIESGTHVFYERKGDGPEKLVGRAVFTMLWKLDGRSWKLARVMSYGHEAVKPAS